MTGQIRHGVVGAVEAVREIERAVLHRQRPVHAAAVAKSPARAIEPAAGPPSAPETAGVMRTAAAALGRPVLVGLGVPPETGQGVASARFRAGEAARTGLTGRLGHAMGEVVVEALRRSGRGLTREKLAGAFDGPPFDTGALPRQVLESVLATHPTLVDADGRRPSPAFVDPARYLPELPVPPEPLEATPPRLAARDVTDFIGLRHAVAAALAGAEGDHDLVEDFQLAVDEMVSNAVRHGRPPVDVTLWAAAGTAVCRVTDRGAGPADPFAGYGPAHGEDLSRGGMGLWLARQLCDHVDVVHEDGGVSVRLTTDLR